MFIIGFEIDLKKLIAASKIATTVGIVQVVLCAAGGYGVAYLLGYV